VFLRSRVKKWQAARLSFFRLHLPDEGSAGKKKFAPWAWMALGKLLSREKNRQQPTKIAPPHFAQPTTSQSFSSINK
jgi:hypothetical protein